MAKTVVEDCRKVQMWWLKKHGYLCQYASGGIEWTNNDDSKSSIGFTISTIECYIRFHYTQTDYYTDEKTTVDYRFNLVTTPCNYGGKRYWFICGLYRDNRYCGRRVGKLYKPPGAKWFGCRYCWDLSYEARQNKLSTTSSYNFLFKILRLNIKIILLNKKIKHFFWKGKITKKYQKLLKYGDVLRVYGQINSQ